MTEAASSKEPKPEISDRRRNIELGLTVGGLATGAVLLGAHALNMTGDAKSAFDKEKVELDSKTAVEDVEIADPGQPVEINVPVEHEQTRSADTVSGQ